jgi:hypothetical protein
MVDILGSHDSECEDGSSENFQPYDAGSKLL